MEGDKCICYRLSKTRESKGHGSNAAGRDREGLLEKATPGLNLGGWKRLSRVLKSKRSTPGSSKNRATDSEIRTNTMYVRTRGIRVNDGGVGDGDRKVDAARL